MELHFSFTFLNLSLLLLFLFKLVFVLLGRSRSHRTSGTKLPPGPWKLPFIGSIHHLAGSMLPHHALRRFSTRYGPLMHLRLGEISVIVISSPSMAKQVMKTHDLAFANRPDITVSKIATYNNQDIAFAPYGAYWRQMRKICMVELLSIKTVRSFASIREEEVISLVKSIISSSGMPVNVTEKVRTTSGLIISRAAFGKKCAYAEEFVLLVSKGSELAGGFDACDFFPSLKILNLVSLQREKLENLHRLSDKILQKIIDEHEENLASTGRGKGESGEEDLVDVLLRHQKSSDLECPITTDNIKAVIQDIFSAGSDTSSITIEWAMSEMMKNPRVMEKAQTEVRLALKGKKIIHEKDIQDLKYLKLVIKETLRLHPPLPLSLPRESREECNIEGYDIPINTKIIVNVWAIGRDSEYWEDSESFKPERFDGSSVEFTGNHFQCIPFGAGRRMCPGISFAVANIELPLAQLLYHFDWELPNVTKPEDLDMTEKIGMSVPRRNDLYLIPTKYKTMYDLSDFE